jgi:hypothetical protein
MPEIVADPPAASCSLLLSESRIQESQSLGPDRFSPRARDARGRFAKGSSGNPQGRPPGIRNPKRRVPDLVARPLSAKALSKLLDRKTYLLRPLAAQLLPPPLKPIDPAERLGIDLSSLRTAEDLRQLLPKVLAAIAHGEITPAEGARLVRRARTRLRAIRRLARLARAVASRRTRVIPAGAGDTRRAGRETNGGLVCTLPPCEVVNQTPAGRADIQSHRSKLPYLSPANAPISASSSDRSWIGSTRRVSPQRLGVDTGRCCEFLGRGVFDRPHRPAEIGSRPHS